MLELLLNINILCSWTGHLLTMGMPLIDESLAELVNVMKNAPTYFASVYLLGLGRTLGACGALGVGAYEAWMMILGRRGMDIMKILRIVIISICLANTGTIRELCDAPGSFLENITHKQAISMNKQVADKEREVATKQGEYLKALRDNQAKIEQQAEATQAYDRNATKQAVADKVGLGKVGEAIGDLAADAQGVAQTISNIPEQFNNWAKRAAALVETKTSEIINDVIRFIGEVIFQMTYYGMLIGQRIFSNILLMFMPIAFGISLFPPFRSAWSQWLSKYLSLSLWPFIVYLILYYVDYLLLFYLRSDLTAYEGLINDKNINSWESIGALGVQAIGTTCMYVVGLLAGAKILSMVPEVASWLIPGGVSSGMGQMSAGVAAAAGGFAGSAAGTAATVGGAAVGGVAGMGARAVAQGGGAAISGARAGASMGSGSGVTGAMGRVGGAIVGAVGAGVSGAASSIGHDVGSAVGGGGRGEAFSRGYSPSGTSQQNKGRANMAREMKQHNKANHSS